MSTALVNHDAGRAAHGVLVGRKRLSPPALPASNCPRELVLRSLGLARNGKLTLLLAPPGFGKTTVLCQWREKLIGAGIGVAWYSVSDLDREPGIFLSMIARALHLSLADDRGKAAGSAEGLEPEDIIERIILRAERFARPIVLMIDDFDRVDHPQIAKIMEELLDILPDSVHLIMSTRRKPSFALSMLAVQGSVRTIDTSELRFTMAEIHALLDIDLDGDELRMVAEHTEGWPAAIQLYRIWRARCGAGQNMPYLGGQVSEIADFLTDQIFSTLSDGCQQLLLDISILEIAEPEIVDHIRNRSDSAQLLAELEAEIPSLVQQIVWEGAFAFRLHPLLAEFAFMMLSRLPGREAELHRRAADQLWRDGHYAVALRHAARARDTALLDQQLASLPFLTIFLTHGASELRTILRETPAGYIDRSPRLRLMLALTHFKTGLFGEARVALERIKLHTVGFTIDNGKESSDLWLDGHVVELLFDIYIDGPTPGIDDRIAELQSHVRDQGLLWALCANLKFVVHLHRGDLVSAEKSMIRARELYRACGIMRFAELYISTHEIGIALAAGAMGKVASLCGLTLRRSEPDENTDAPLSAMARLASAAIDHERSYSIRSADMVRLALDRFDEGEAWFDQYAIAFPIMVDAAWRRGGIDPALDTLARARARAQRRGLACLSGFLDALEAHTLARAGLPSNIAVLLAAPPPQLWRVRLLLARTGVIDALNRGDHVLASQLAAALAREGEDAGRLTTWVKGLILGAMAAQAAQDPVLASETMLDALRLSYPEGLAASFVEEGDTVRAILEAITGHDQPAFCRQHALAILEIFDRRTQFAAADSLSDQEWAIMAHLAEGASNKLIGRRLGLSHNTIKFHLKKIYSKLGVASRKEAVSSAFKDQ